MARCLREASHITRGRRLSVIWLTERTYHQLPPPSPPIYLYCWQWENFTIGHNGQNQHFAELRQKVCSSIHDLVLQSGLPSLDGKLERFVTKKMKEASDRLS